MRLLDRLFDVSGDVHRDESRVAIGADRETNDYLTTTGAQRLRNELDVSSTWKGLCNRHDDASLHRLRNDKANIGWYATEPFVVDLVEL